MNKQYAHAFFELAKEDNNLELAKESFDAFIAVFKSAEDFQKVLMSPKISIDEKKNLLKNLLSECFEEFVFFLYVVLDNGRMDKIVDIYKEFNYLYNEEMEVKFIDVYSVEKLSQTQINKLKECFSKMYQDYTIIMNNYIDPTILGGYRVLINGLSIDLSVKRKLDNLLKHTLN